MKGTEQFKEIIQKHLENFALEDVVFAEKLKNKSKNIDDCVQYILNEVKKSGINGFSDDEIFGMAIHYYDEEKIDIGKPIPKVQIVTNRSVDKPIKELTEKVKTVKKPKQTVSTKKTTQVSIFDLGA